MGVLGAVLLLRGDQRGLLGEGLHSSTRSASQVRELLERSSLST